MEGEIKEKYVIIDEMERECTVLRKGLDKNIVRLE